MFLILFIAGFTALVAANAFMCVHLHKAKWPAPRRQEGER